MLVVGAGPAGFTLAHHLMNDGHTVVGIDGLKIEPLPADLSGVLPMGRRCISARSITSRTCGTIWTTASWRASASRRVRHHGALGQELPEGDPPAAGAAAAVRHGRRRTVRRHAERRGCVRCRFDHIESAVHGGGRPTVVDEERAGARVRQASIS